MCTRIRGGIAYKRKWGRGRRMTREIFRIEQMLRICHLGMPFKEYRYSFGILKLFSKVVLDNFSWELF